MEKDKKIPFAVLKKGAVGLAMAGMMAFTPFIAGCSGAPGENGDNGANGKSAYELAVEAGFEGTLQEWLASLKGNSGSTSFTHIKYADSMPDSDDDILTSGIGDYIGIYVGTSVTAPTSYAAYSWYKTKGNNPKITYDKDGYIIVDGVKTDVCLYPEEVAYPFNYTATTYTNYKRLLKQGNALGNTVNDRVSLWFDDYKFKAGTKFKCVGDDTTYKMVYLTSRDGTNFSATNYPNIAEDSSWIDNTTASKEIYNSAASNPVRHYYDADTKTFTLAADSYVRIGFAYKNNANVTTTTAEWEKYFEVDGYYLEVENTLNIEMEGIPEQVGNYGMNAVAHRGYSTVAPENTLPAYILAKEKGFTMAECDVTFTKDNVGVLLHDDSINRTSNGTGNIGSLTLAEARQFDYGSWKSSEYTGVTIPTFDEFIRLCKYIDLHPYIEIKAGATQANVEGLVDIVNKYGMLDRVTWISFDINMLRYVKGKDDTARLGYLAAPITEAKITELKDLRTGKNEVFFSADNTKVTTALIERCIEEAIPLEVCTVDDPNTIANLHPYITGVTSNDKIAGQILYDKYKD